MNYFLSGDTHGADGIVKRLNVLKENNIEDPALIILGDAGLNFYLNDTDRFHKKMVNDCGIPVYIVRGNHEARPEEITGMQWELDNDVKEIVYMEDEFPFIRYLADGITYEFNGHKTLVVGGAYSVDKWLRLRGRDPETEEWTGWFKDEQLSDEWWEDQLDFYRCHPEETKFDFVLTHTCPYDWMPTDLFLSIDQRTIDNSTEKWLMKMRDMIDYKVWCFGHFHDDRLMRPHVEMFFKDMENIEDLLNTWDNYDKTGEVPWWMVKDPNFYMGR